ncbi:MAG: sigma D regulator [Gammaproteobacteria bacterium]|nr:sigma D regulator [Gammaproteobacteria bacterium]
MLESCKDAKERWGGVHSIIDRWLNERQELLVLYCAIKGLKPYSPRETPLSVKVEAFCQVLMDYCSAGHFEVYEQLIREAKEFNDGGLELAKHHYPRLEEITVKCVEFNDNYDCAEQCIEKLTDLPKDLSELGELLEERFELEDELIEALHNVHKEMIA